jgi:hypothetical protein
MKYHIGIDIYEGNNLFNLGGFGMDDLPITTAIIIE